MIEIGSLKLDSDFDYRIIREEDTEDADNSVESRGIYDRG